MKCCTRKSAAILCVCLQICYAFTVSVGTVKGLEVLKKAISVCYSVAGAEDEDLIA